HAILHAATRHERDIYVGFSGKLMSSVGKQAPGMMDWVGERILMQQELRDEPPRNPEVALYRAGTDGRIHGDHPGRVRKTSLYTRASLHPMITGALLGAAGIAAIALLSGDRSRRW